MPRKNKSRKKKGAGIFDFLKTGESKSYTKKRCKEYENEITKLEKRIDELKAKQEEYKCLGGDMMTDNPMQQPDIESEFDSESTAPQQVDEEEEEEEQEQEEEEEEEEKMKPLYPIEKEPDVEGVLGEVPAPEYRKDDIAKTVTGLKGGRRRRRKSRRKSKRKSKKRRKLRKKKSRKRRRRKSRR